MALMTIQRIGKKPNAAPSAALSRVRLTGMAKATTATTIATTRDTRPAIHALTRSTPRRTNRVTSGIAAHRAESPRDPPTGSTTCLNTVLTSLLTAGSEPPDDRAPTVGSGADEVVGGEPADGGVENLDRVRHRHPGAAAPQCR